MLLYIPDLSIEVLFQFHPQVKVAYIVKDGRVYS